MAVKGDLAVLSGFRAAFLGFGQLRGGFLWVARLRDDPELSVNLGLWEAAVFRACSHDAVCDELPLRWYWAA